MKIKASTLNIKFLANTGDFLIVATKILIYAFIIFLVNSVVFIDSEYQTGFNEQSFTEWSQEIFLLTSAIIYLVVGINYPLSRGFSFGIAGFFGVAFVREYNNYLNGAYFGGWQLPAFLVACLATYFVVKNKSTLFPVLRTYLKLPAFGFTLSGMLITFVFSRLFGMKTIWASILEVESLSGSYRTVKNAAEEGTELVGYAIILIGAIEFLFNIRSIQRVKIKAKEQKHRNEVVEAA